MNCMECKAEFSKDERQYTRDDLYRVVSRMGVNPNRPELKTIFDNMKKNSYICCRYCFNDQVKKAKQDKNKAVNHVTGGKFPWKR